MVTGAPVGCEPVEPPAPGGVVAPARVVLVADGAARGRWVLVTVTAGVGFGLALPSSRAAPVSSGPGVPLSEPPFPPPPFPPLPPPPVSPPPASGRDVVGVGLGEGVVSSMSATWTAWSRSAWGSGAPPSSSTRACALSLTAYLTNSDSALRFSSGNGFWPFASAFGTAM